MLHLLSQPLHVTMAPQDHARSPAGAPESQEPSENTAQDLLADLGKLRPQEEKSTLSAWAPLAEAQRLPPADLL